MAITITTTGKTVTISNGSEEFKGGMNEFILIKAGNIVLITKNGSEIFRSAITSITVNDTQLTVENYKTETEAIFGSASSVAVSNIDDSKTEIPATTAEQAGTKGQFLRGIFSTLLTRLSNLVGGRSLVENLGRPSTARQVTLVANTVNDIQLTTGIRRLTIYATVDSFYLIGSAAQTPSLTTGHFISSGERLDLLLNSTDTHIAFISASDGMIYITELTTPTT